MRSCIENGGFDTPQETEAEIPPSPGATARVRMRRRPSGTGGKALSVADEKRIRGSLHHFTTCTLGRLLPRNRSPIPWKRKGTSLTKKR